MREIITINAMTWDHQRGYDPMLVTSNLFCKNKQNTYIKWHKRSLQEFADMPINSITDEFDLIVIDHPHVGEIADSGVLLNLSEQNRNTELATLKQQSLGPSYRSYEFNDSIWALPTDAAAPISAYRPDLLKTPCTSWDEVIRLAEKNQVIWPLIPINALMSYFNLLANIGEPFAENKSGANISTSIAVLEQMRAVTKNIPMHCFSMDPIAAYEWLSTRSSHSYIPYLYGYSNYSRDGFRPHLIKSANIPSLGNNGPIGSPLGGAGIAISSNCKHKEIALEYAFWIASSECQKNAYCQYAGQPANKLAWEDEKCNKDNNNFFKNTLQTLEQSYLRPRHDGYLRFQDIAGNIIFEFLIGQLSVNLTAQMINAEYNKSLNN